jgi:hypothetical protein
MDIRTPDNYKMETLMDTNDLDSSQELSCNELEQAMLESLEESWRVNAECSARWEKFQPILSRLKRFGYYDKIIQKLYDMLSVLLYKYSYNMEETLSMEDYLFIDKNMKQFRMKEGEQTILEDALIRLRFCS